MLQHVNIAVLHRQNETLLLGRAKLTTVLPLKQEHNLI